MSDPHSSSPTTLRFLRSLRIAVLVVAATVLAGSAIFRNLPRYQPAWLQILAYVALASVVATELVLVRRRQAWGRLRWPALATATGASMAAIVSLPPGAAVTSVDWAFGTVGWMYLILLLDRPLIWLVAVLLMHEGLTVGGLLLSGAATEGVLLNLAAGSLGALGYPLTAGSGARALRAFAAAADAAVREAAEIRTADELAARLHDHRREKFTDLYQRTLPILRGLADASLDPADPQVRRACAIEAARMRRLFAETDVAPDSLLHALRHSADTADRRGVLVEMQAKGDWPDPPAPVRQAIIEAPAAALATAHSRARVTVVGSPGTLAVSVVSDCGPMTLPTINEPDVELSTVTDGDTLWVETRWTPRN